MVVSVNARAGGRLTGAALVPTEFDFSVSIPAPFTFARSGNATYRDSAGVWRTAGSGVARCGPFAHYPDNVNGGWFWREPFVTNKMTDRNAAPTDTTGWAKSGDAASTLAAVTPPAGSLAAAGLNVLCTGNVLYFNNGSGVAAAYMDSAATFGNTNPHTVSAWVYVVAGTITLTRTGSGTPETLAITANGGFRRYALRTVPNASGNQFRIQAAAGAQAYVILAQIEEQQFLDSAGNAVPTTPIVTAAATASRNADRVYINNLNTQSWFDQAKATLLFDLFVPGFTAGFSQNLLVLANGTATSGGSANLHGFRILHTAPGFLQINTVSAGSVLTQTSINKLVTGRRTAAAIGFDQVSRIIASEVAHADMSNSPAPTGPFDWLEIGGNQNTGNSGCFCGFRKFKVYRRKLTADQIVSEMVEDLDDAIIMSGQSLSDHYFVSAALNNTAQRTGLTLLDSIAPARRNSLVRGSTSGAALLKANEGSFGYYIDDDGIAGNVAGYGAPWFRLDAAVRGWAERPNGVKAVIWNQGQGGLGAVPVARHKEGLRHIINHVRGVLGYAVPFILSPMDRATYSATGTWADIHNAYTELASEMASVFVGPEHYDTVLSDTVHPVEGATGYDILATRDLRKALKVAGYNVTGSVDGPRVTNVSRTGRNFTVTCAHDGGTDFTVASDVRGFFVIDANGVLFDGNISGATKASATSFTFTTAADPVGPITFYVGYDTLSTIDTSKLPRDNSAEGLLLRRTKIAVA